MIAASRNGRAERLRIAMPKGALFADSVRVLREAGLDVGDLGGPGRQLIITTEDAENNFIPDYGRITTYRSAGGFAVRLDGGNGFGGAVITPYFDSLLVKVTARGLTHHEAAGHIERCLQEFRVRGVKTNIPFLINLVTHPEFLAGRCTA